jgi:outer membrane lipoprotein-sorting protein
MTFTLRVRGARATAAAALVLWCGTSVASGQTVDDIVRSYLEARGGAARLRSVQSLRFTGTMQIGDVKAPFTLELARPNRMRTEFVVQGQTGVRAFDGQHAWARVPLPGEPPRPMSPEEAADARAQADVDMSPLVDAAAKGYSIELVGRDRLPSGDTWKLLVRGRDSPPRTLHVDARSHLVVETIDTRSEEGQPTEFVTEISDYRSVGGLVYPHRIEVGPRGKPERQRLLIEKVEINPALDASRFAMPAARRAKPPAPKPQPPAVLP